MKLPNRKLQRLKDYDYSQNGAYFITMCTQNRLNLFGTVIDDSVMLNNAGKMIEERLLNISNFDDVTLAKYIIMPDHVHAIIFIICDDYRDDGAGGGGTPQGAFPTRTIKRDSISDIVRKFKTITTKLYIDGVKNGEYPVFDKKIWQKSYHDRIIRNKDEYYRICNYIDDNPKETH